MFTCGAFFCVFLTKSLSKCLNSTKPALPWRISGCAPDMECTYHKAPTIKSEIFLSSIKTVSGERVTVTVTTKPLIKQWRFKNRPHIWNYFKNQTIHSSDQDQEWLWKLSLFCSVPFLVSFCFGFYIYLSQRDVQIFSIKMAAEKWIKCESRLVLLFI